MKYLLLAFLFLIPCASLLVSADPYYVNANVTYTSVGDHLLDHEGIRYTPAVNQTLTSVVKSVNSTARGCRIINESAAAIFNGLFDGQVCYPNVQLQANRNYSIAVSGTGNDTNGSAVFPIVYPYLGNFTEGCSGAITCPNPSFTQAWNIIGIGVTVTNQDNSSFIPAVYDTKSVVYKENVTLSGSSSISSVLLYIGGQSKTASATSIGSPGNKNYTLSSSFTVPILPEALNTTWFWAITYANTTQQNLSSKSQFVGSTNLSICNPYVVNRTLNITFRNESIGLEKVNATVSSTWVYYLGDGTVNKTYTYSNGTAQSEYNFCTIPSYQPLTVNPTLTYANAESQQRTYTSPLTLYNQTTNLTLNLLPTVLGQYVTFVVKNLAEQTISGALVNVTSSSFGIVGSTLTDSAGSATFFLNPLSSYTISVSKEGYPQYTTSITPSQTTYTISLGGSTTANVTDLTKGISYTIIPSNTTLSNSTVYTFNFTISSTYYNLDSFGFNLSNGSTVFASASGSGSSGGTASTTLNTVNNKTIVMNYFWSVNGTSNNASRIWIIFDNEDTSWSLAYLFNDVNAYADSGLFGLTGFGITLGVFAFIFIVTGILSYQFSLTSPVAIMGVVFGMVALFDVAFGLIINPLNAVPFFPTVFTGLILLAFVLREVS